MADEPRRSGRATKGQHTKHLDPPEVPPQKRKGKGQTKAPKPSNEPTPAPSDESEEIIRCICGQYEEEEDVERDMICCDKCSAWQHNDCMGLTFAKGEEPAEYFCEQCKPENHQDLLAKIARGEKPWEEAAKRRAQEAEEKKARRKKGGKRKKKGRASDVKSEVSEEVNASAAATPARGVSHAGGDEKKNGPADNRDGRRQSSQKRKFEPENVDTPESEQKQKLQRLSTQSVQAAAQDEKAMSPAQGRRTGSTSVQAHSRRGSKSEMSPTKIVEGVADIDNAARRNVANALIKLFVEQAAEAQKRGTFKLSEGETKEMVGQRLGLGVEYAMYQNLSGGRGEPSETYKVQTRTILFNVKKNPSLRDQLLVGSLSPGVLSMMSTEDMASKELRQKDAEIKREAEKQHIIVQEQGPRIRRTHKGEEFVEDDAHHISSEPIFSTAPARRETAPDLEGRPPSTASPGLAGSMSPTSGHRRESNDNRGPQGSREGDDRRKSSSNFNIQNVWSNVHSPGSAPSQDKPAFHAPSPYHEPPSTTKVQADAEIDQLLKDEDIESPPYSPKDVHEDGVVWRGKMAMHPVAEFTSTARHVGGAELSGRIPWSQLIPPKLLIDGRIDIQLATNYLCGLRFSQSTDVSVISITAPNSPNDHAEFEKLFKYFSDRKRYGVIGKHPLPTVKDTYIVPVEAGSGKKPEFIELLENNTVPEPTPERMLLVVFVVKTNSSTPSSQPTPQHPNPDPNSVMASPLTTTSATQQQPQFPASMAGASANPQTASQPAPVSPPAQHYSPPPAQPPQQQENLTGAAAAQQVLGPHAKSPAVEQLLQQAPNAEIAQLEVIAGILSKTPNAANDYQLLMNALLQTTNGQT